MSCESFGCHGRKSSQPVRESNADPQKRGFTIWLESLVYIFCPLDVYHTMYSDTAVTLISLKLISWFILGGVYQAGVPTRSLEIGIFPQQIVFSQQPSQFSTTCFFPRGRHHWVKSFLQVGFRYTWYPEKLFDIIQDYDLGQCIWQV